MSDEDGLHHMSDDDRKALTKELFETLASAIRPRILGFRDTATCRDCVFRSLASALSTMLASAAGTVIEEPEELGEFLEMFLHQLDEALQQNGSDVRANFVYTTQGGDPDTTH